ncbi:Synaptogyrin-2 [Chamberlinius hualienensis]
MNGGAYGAGKAGSAFDPILFIQRPQVIVRLVNWLFSIIVFGCIASRGYIGEQCAYNESNGTCSFGVGIGVIAFLASMTFIALDALFDNMSSIKTRKHVVIADMAFAGIWSFLWFVCFCYLTDQWRKTTLDSLPLSYVASNLRAAIAFSFFSIFSWAASCYFAVQRFRQGVDAAFAPSYEADPHMIPHGGSYAGYPVGGTETEEGYQEPPFMNNEKGPGTNFQAPAY